MAEAQRHAISCPLCRVGHAIIVLERYLGELRAENMNAVRCVTCKGHFRVRAQVQFVGVPIESDNGKVRVG